MAIDTAERMTLQKGLARVLSQSDVLLAVGMLVIVGMMVIPLPTILLDMLISLNLAAAVVILLVALYTNEPLDFSVFPSLLLVVTLFRLALNVSSSRLILLQADAGEVIHSFGSFVVAGNYVVGIIVFLILTVIQFVVITNGAGRVAEVGARFTLDAMPGKQMSIDADLNAGLINEHEARRRRRVIEQEADFYGSMDGASKFVRGDAIAGIVIVMLNIVGGVVIGIMQLGLAPKDALGTYTLLTIGDGLVTLIPALLISTATGIVVTRAAGNNEISHLGNDMAAQILRSPKPLFIVSAMLLTMAIVPGLPKLPFIAMGAALGFVAWALRGKQRDDDAATTVRQQEERAQEATSVDAVVGLLQVDPIEVEIGYGLIPIVDESDASNLLHRITGIRRQLAADLGFVVPTVRIRDNLQIPPNTYAVKLRGVEIGKGELMVNHYLAMNAGFATEDIEGIATTEPAFGLPALWISNANRERAEMLGYTVVDAPSVLATHLTELIRRHAPEVLSRQDVQTLMNNLKNEYPTVVEELVPAILTVGEVQKVLQNLLLEHVSIRDLVTIAETLADHGRNTKDAAALTEFVRQALGRQITGQHLAQDGTLPVLTLSPALEQTLAASLQQTDQGLAIIIDPTLAQRVITATAENMERLAGSGHQPIVLCPSRIRRPFRRLTERALPHLTVLAYAEINPQTEVQAMGMVDIDEG